MLCYIMLYYVMLCYVMLCYVILYHIIYTCKAAVRSRRRPASPPADGEPPGGGQGEGDGRRLRRSRPRGRSLTGMPLAKSTRALCFGFSPSFGEQVRWRDVGGQGNARLTGRALATGLPTRPPQVSRILRIWEDWGLFAPQFVAGLSAPATRPRPNGEARETPGCSRSRARLWPSELELRERAQLVRAGRARLLLFQSSPPLSLYVIQAKPRLLDSVHVVSADSLSGWKPRSWSA